MRRTDVGGGASRCRDPKRKEVGTREEQPGVPVWLEGTEQGGERIIISGTVSEAATVSQVLPHMPSGTNFYCNSFHVPVSHGDNVSGLPHSSLTGKLMIDFLSP